MANLKTAKVPKPDNSPAARASMPDWTLSDGLEPIYDRATNEHMVIIITDSNTTNDMVQNKIDAKREAIEYLLRWHDKKLVFQDLDNNDVDVVALANHFDFAHVLPEFESAHLDPRPGSKLKVLVRIKDKYFQAIPERSLQERREHSNQEMLELDVRGIILLATDFESDQIDEQFEKFIQLLSKFEKQSEVHEIPPNIVFKKDRERLERFLVDLKDFLAVNGFDIDNSPEPFRITLNFQKSSPVRLFNVTIAKKDNTRHPIRKKLPVLQKRLENSRIANYVLDTKSVNENLDKMNSWFDFADSYVESFDKEADRQFAPSLKLGRSFFQKADAAKKKMAHAQKVASKYGINLDPGVRTGADVETQKVSIFKNKKEMEIAVNNDVSFSGDSVTQNLERLTENLDSIGQSYTRIMNKIDIASLIEDIVKSFAFDIRVPSFNFKIPSVPTWSFPEIPTFDIMIEIPKQITLNIEGLIKLALMGLLKQVTIKHLECKDYRKFAGQAGDYGLAKLKGFLSDEQQTTVGEDIEAKVDPVLDQFGLQPDGGVSDYFDKISERLNPPEILDLLKGTASEFTLGIVKECDPSIGSLDQIGDFFGYLGTFIEPEILTGLENQAKLCTVRDMCEAGIEAKKVLLNSNVGRRASQDEVDRMLAQRELEELQRLEDLLALLDQEDIFSEGALPSNPEITDLLEDLCDPESKNFKSIVPRDPPSVDFLNDKVINTMFDGALMAFNADITSFKPSMKDTVREDASDEQIAAAKSARQKQRDNDYDFSDADIAGLRADPDDVGLLPAEIRVAPTLQSAYRRKESVFRSDVAQRPIYEMRLPVLSSIVVLEDQDLIEQLKEQVESRVADAPTIRADLDDAEERLLNARTREIVADRRLVELRTEWAPIDHIKYTFDALENRFLDRHPDGYEDSPENFVRRAPDGNGNLQSVDEHEREGELIVFNPLTNENENIADGRFWIRDWMLHKSRWIKNVRFNKLPRYGREVRERFFEIHAEIDTAQNEHDVISNEVDELTEEVRILSENADRILEQNPAAAATSELPAVEYFNDFQWRTIDEQIANRGAVRHNFTLFVSDPRRNNPITIRRNELVEPSVQDSITNFIAGGDFIASNARPFQHEMFHNIVRKSFLSKFSNRASLSPGLLNKINDLDGPFATLFRDEIYPNVITSLLRLYMRKASESKFFDVDKLDEIDFSASLLPCPPGQHPRTDLLNIAKTKKDTKNDYNNPACVSVEGLNELPPMEAAGVIGAIKLMVRLYMLELALKSIFILSEFNIKELFKDRLIIDFTIQTIMQDLRGDPRFQLEFRREISRIIAIRQERGEQFVDPFDEENPQPLNLETSDDKLLFLIKEQAIDVFDELYNRLFTQIEKDSMLDETLILSGLPINVAKSTLDDIGDDESNRNPEVVRNFSTPHYKNGNFIIEKYIRVEDKETIVDDGFSKFLSNRLGGLSRPSLLEPLLEPTKDAHTSGIVSNEMLKKLLLGIRHEGFGNRDNGNFEEGRMFTDYFETWKYGLRLSYVLPVGRDGIIDKMSSFKKLKPDNGHVEDYEKAFFLQNISFGQGEFNDRGATLDEYFLIPLHQEEIPIDNFERFEVTNQSLNSLIQQINDDEFPIEELKQRLKNSDIYKVMFGYLAPISRILSLVAIYSVKGVSLTEPETEFMFTRTKQEIKNLFNTLISNAKDDWWSQQDPEYQNSGGNVGQAKSEAENVTTQGTSPSTAKMAAMTVPLMMRGMAERFDPSYKLMKRLDDAGALPVSAAGPNYGALPYAGPINIFGPFLGGGPIITPLGLMALGMPATPGSQKRTNERKKAKRKAEGEEVIEGCIPDEEE